MIVMNHAFADSPLGPYYILPLLVYHPVQMIIGGFVAPYIATWVDAHSLPLPSYTP